MCPCVLVTFRHDQIGVGPWKGCTQWAHAALDTKLEYSAAAVSCMWGVASPSGLSVALGTWQLGSRRQLPGFADRGKRIENSSVQANTSVKRLVLRGAAGALVEREERNA